MSWLTEAYDRNVKGGSLKRRRWDPVGDADAYLSKVFGKRSPDLVEEDEVPSPLMRAGDVDAHANLGAFQNIRKKKQGRLAANLSPASGASILTSG